MYSCPHSFCAAGKEENTADFIIIFRVHIHSTCPSYYTVQYTVVPRGYTWVLKLCLRNTEKFRN